MEEKQQGLTPEQKEAAGLMLSSLNAYAPDLGAIREAIQTLGKTMDPKEAYLMMQDQRPAGWTPLPSFEVMMGE